MRDKKKRGCPIFNTSINKMKNGISYCIEEDLTCYYLTLLKFTGTAIIGDN